jgi:hypothetical protein
MVVMVVVVAVVPDFNQRPTERLSEAVADLDRLYLDPVHDYSNVALSAMKTWGMMETFGRCNRFATSRYTLSRRYISGKGRRYIREFTVSNSLAIGCNRMTEANTIERRVLFNRRRYDKETYRCRSSAHLSERCRCSNDSES